MSCPKCGSENVQVVTETKTKGYSASKGCCGILLFPIIGFFGLLCGFCGMGKSKTRS
jgi:uncharacterized Zn finger protein